MIGFHRPANQIEHVPDDRNPVPPLSCVPNGSHDNARAHFSCLSMTKLSGLFLFMLKFKPCEEFFVGLKVLELANEEFREVLIVSH